MQGLVVDILVKALHVEPGSGGSDLPPLLCLTLWIWCVHVRLCLSQEEYVSEGLEWSFVKYQDNQSCLDLLEGGPVGVFSLLNEVHRSLCLIGLYP